MPSLLDYMEQFKEVPRHLAFSLAALMEFYSAGEMNENGFLGYRGETAYHIMDDPEVLHFFADHSNKPLPVFVQEFLSRESFWGQDLTRHSKLTEIVTDQLTKIRTLGIREALRSLEIKGQDLK